MSREQPKVTLLTWTNYPLETVYSVWEASKETMPLRTPEEIHRDVDKHEVEELFRAVIAQHIPVGEHIDFVFMMEDVSVSWREQAVRHRIGTKPSPERLGADMVMVDEFPNLADSTWWSQSMRIMDMGKFAQNHAYRLPKSIAEHENKDLHVQFCATMQRIENTYNQLVAAGVPMEDARELMPLGSQHRISWKLNLSAIQHIVGKRGCWILQLGLWGPIIMGMIEEMVKKVHPIFAELVTPPCLKGDAYKGCVYMEECRRRLTEDDALPPCPLHLSYEEWQVSMNGVAEEWLQKHQWPRKEETLARAKEYEKFWKRNPWTGRRL